uniref:DUF1618 domain-containing protein n=1 Tax=Leersia perrieri TaxID=77586 RepID=A0A0D9XUG1_9ORYZ
MYARAAAARLAHLTTARRAAVASAARRRLIDASSPRSYCSIAAVDQPPSPLPLPVRGIFINYIDHGPTHFFAHPSLATPARPTIKDKSGGFLGFLPQTGDYIVHDEWCVLDHSNGLLLCRNETSYRLFIPKHEKGIYRRAHTTYLTFDPAVSPPSSHYYEVFMIPNVPEPEPDPEAETTPDGIHVKVKVIDDPCRTMEWPPSPWRVDVFSSRTGGLWKEREFVWEGEPLGTVEEIRLDPLEPTWYGPQQRYAVYHQGALYVHCRGGFVARFSLSNDTYQIIKTPEINSEKPYFGRSEKGLCFGIITRHKQLQVWILRESCGQLEWILKYKNDLKAVSAEVRSIDFPDKKFGPWIIEDDTDSSNHEKIETVSKVNSEWDSDNDDFISVVDRSEGSSCGYTGVVNIFGFHPYKEIIFLETSFNVAAYHLNSSKIQFLGFSRPESYYLNYTNGIDESFPYTPCFTGELRHPRRRAKKKKLGASSSESSAAELHGSSQIPSDGGSKEDQ